MQADAEARLVHAHGFFVDNGGIFEIRPHAAIFLWHHHAQKPLLPRLGPQFPAHHAVFLPLFVKRHGFFLQKLAVTVAEKFVLVGEKGAFHEESL